MKDLGLQNLCNFVALQDSYLAVCVARDLLGAGILGDLKKSSFFGEYLI